MWLRVFAWAALLLLIGIGLGFLVRLLRPNPVYSVSSPPPGQRRPSHPVG